MKSNNYTIFSQQFNDISHPWRQKNREPLPTALYPISRYSGARYKGGSLYWKKVAFNILTRMLLNSYILYKENTDDRNIMSRYTFNVKVIEALCKEHFDKKLTPEGECGVCEIPQGKEKDCCMCSNRTIPGGRKRTRTMCSRCTKGLHGPCFPKHKC